MPPQAALYSFLAINTLLIVIAIVIGTAEGNPARHFGENKFITLFSSIQLLGVAVLSFIILHQRSKDRGTRNFFLKYFIWFLIGIGFVFLSVDEFFKIHESIDDWVHSFFQFTETSVTDHIDDFVVAAYALFGIVTLYFYREELKKFNQTLPSLLFGFAFLFLTIVLDVVTNGEEIVLMIVGEQWVDAIHLTLSIAEDSFKLYAEAFFILWLLAVYTCEPVISHAQRTRPSMQP